MKKSKVLLVDALINLIIGIILLLFNQFVDLLGIPPTNQLFYPTIFGGVLIGIAIALIVEYFRRSENFVGLG